MERIVFEKRNFPTFNFGTVPKKGVEPSFFWELAFWTFGPLDLWTFGPLDLKFLFSYNLYAGGVSSYKSYLSINLTYNMGYTIFHESIISLEKKVVEFYNVYGL